MRRKLTTAQIIYYGDPLVRTSVSPGNYRHSSSQRRVRSAVKMGGVVKTLRRSNLLSRSVFSTAGSFGLLFRKRTQRAQRSKKFILARSLEKTIPTRTKKSFSLENFILGSKISFSIENFNPWPCFSAAREGSD